MWQTSQVFKVFPRFWQPFVHAIKSKNRIRPKDHGQLFTEALEEASSEMAELMGYKSAKGN